MKGHYEECAATILKGVRFATPKDQALAIANVGMMLQVLVERAGRADKEVAKAQRDLEDSLKRAFDNCFVATASAAHLAFLSRLIGNGKHAEAQAGQEPSPREKK